MIKRYQHDRTLSSWVQTSTDREQPDFDKTDPSSNYPNFVLVDKRLLIQMKQVIRSFTQASTKTDHVPHPSDEATIIIDNQTGRKIKVPVIYSEDRALTKVSRQICLFNKENGR